MGCVTIHKRPDGWRVRYQYDMPGTDSAHTARLVSLLFDQIETQPLTEEEYVTAFKQIIRQVRAAETQPDANLWGTALREARASLGLPQSYMAKIVRVDHSAISRWEAALASPDAVQMARIVRFFARLGIVFDPFRLDRERLDPIDTQEAETKEIDDA